MSMKLCKLLLLFLLNTYFLSAQNSETFWEDASTTRLESVDSDIWIAPSISRSVSLDLSAFERFLNEAPLRSANATPLVIPIPMPDNTIQQFAVEQTLIMEESLARQYPEIKTFVGTGIEDPSAKIYLDITPKGFHGMILSPEGTVYIDPYFENSNEFYSSYYKKDFKTKKAAQWSCQVLTEGSGVQDPASPTTDPQFNTTTRNQSVAISLRTYRIAISATKEYTNQHGGTVAGGLAAITTTMQRINGVYETELAISFTLVNNNNLVIQTNSNPGPFRNDNNDIDRNGSHLDQNIGNANYDIGHVFTTNSGVAGLGVVCGNSKAAGTTGLSNPMGDPFDIDFVAHEIGHQCAGNHTFNGSTGSCSGGNRNGSTAYEPGSGATIQAYAGICGAQDLQNNSDDYFHLISLMEMNSYMHQGTGSSCGTVTNNGNNTPTANANSENIDGKSIPKGTPFEVTGVGTDPDSDPLTYTWEEWDLGPQGNINANSTTAVLFRSFKPTTSPTRVFPKIADILTNTTTFGEILPNVTRDIKLQFVVRDNKANGGGFANDQITLKVDASAGPFAITNLNSSSTISGTTNISWDVANTNSGTVNCPNVSILLSTDGGQTFPVTLSASTPNDGSQTVSLPNLNSNMVRLKVKCADNVFFDINNANLTITPSIPSNCDITTITAGAQGACTGNNQYTQAVTVTYSEAPASGDLVVNGQNFPIGTSPQTVVLTGLTADGNSVNVTANFSTDFNCSRTVNNLFTAPTACVTEICTTYTNTTTTSIPTTQATVTSTLNIPDDLSITDVNITNINGQHTYLSDLIINIKSPDGTSVTLFNSLCGNLSSTINVGFDDAAASSQLPCPFNNGNSYQPLGSLADFNDKSSQGNWVLEIIDQANLDGGTINSWSIEICGIVAGEEDPCQENSLAINQMNIASGIYQSGGIITSTGTVEASSNVSFKAPNSITLLPGFEAKSSSIFLATIENCVSAFDEAATFRTANSFSNSPSGINTLQVFPNPFRETVTFAFSLAQPTAVSIHIFNMNGQLVHTLISQENKTAGNHQVDFTAYDMETGMYYATLRTPDQLLTKQLVLIK